MLHYTKYFTLALLAFTFTFCKVPHPEPSTTTKVYINNSSSRDIIIELYKLDSTWTVYDTDGNISENYFQTIKRLLDTKSIKSKESYSYENTDDEGFSQPTVWLSGNTWYSIDVDSVCIKDLNNKKYLYFTDRMFKGRTSSIDKTVFEDEDYEIISQDKKQKTYKFEISEKDFENSSSF